MCIYKKSRKFTSYGLEKPWLKQGLHYLFEILLSCCVAPYELSRNSTPFTGLTITYSSDLGYSFTMDIFYNLPQFLLRGLFSIYILSWATKIRTWTTRTKIWCTAIIRQPIIIYISKYLVTFLLSNNKNQTNKNYKHYEVSQQYQQRYFNMLVPNGRTRTCDPLLTRHY